MTYEEMIKLTETNNEMIEKLSLNNKWIARQYMETCKIDFDKLKNQGSQIIATYDTVTGLSRDICTATINDDGLLKVEINSDNN